MKSGNLFGKGKQTEESPMPEIYNTRNSNSVADANTSDDTAMNIKIDQLKPFLGKIIARRAEKNYHGSGQVYADRDCKRIVGYVGIDHPFELIAYCYPSGATYNVAMLHVSILNLEWSSDGIVKYTPKTGWLILRYLNEVKDMFDVLD